LENGNKEINGNSEEINRNTVEIGNNVEINGNNIETSGDNYVKIRSGSRPEGVSQDGDKKYTSYKDMILDLIEAEVEFVVSFHTNPDHNQDLPEEERKWNIKEVYETMRTVFPFSPTEKDQLLAMGKNKGGKLEDVEERHKIVEFLFAKAKSEYAQIEAKMKMAIEQGIVNMSAEAGTLEEKAGKFMHDIEKNVLLRAIDMHWVDYLVEIDHMRKSIGLRGYAQRDPLIEYRKETFHMFNNLLANIQKEIVYAFFKVGVGLQLAPTIMATDKMTLEGAKKDMSEQGAYISKKPRNDAGDKVGRNDPCPCGSGKKYKKCHGA
jgi:preprotein translocase subunit SecA